MYVAENYDYKANSVIVITQHCKIHQQVLLFSIL